jgi:hypothetical protein
MNANRKTATIVGILYIIGTAAGILSVVFTQAILNDPDYLVKIHSNGNPITIGALFVLLMGLSLALVPVVMYPILKKYNEALAMGYVVYRGGLETFTYISTVLCWLLLVPLSQGIVQAGATQAANFQALGDLLRKAAETGSTLTAIVFPLGALMLYYLLYRSNLIPRWISIWGVIAVILNLLSTGLAPLFGLLNSMSPVQTAANLPIFLQEMVMAVWLIVKGFNPSAIASGFARAEMSQGEEK